jgi:hypothetical protein
MRIWTGHAASTAIRPQRNHADCRNRPHEAGPAADRGRARQGQGLVPLWRSRTYAAADAAAGVRLAGDALSGICRLDLYGAWRLLTIFEAPDRCVLLLIAEHTRTANHTDCCTQRSPSASPRSPQTKPSCCDAEGQPPIDPGIVERFERGLRDLGRALPTTAKAASRRRRYHAPDQVSRVSVM